MRERDRESLTVKIHVENRTKKEMKFSKDLFHRYEFYHSVKIQKNT